MTEVYKHFEKLLAGFQAKFGSPPELISRAPGRVNLIGEHTDYNDGWVLPMAIPFEVNVAVRRRDDGLVRLAALDLDESAEFSLADMSPSDALWLRYPQGVAWAMQQAGHELRGVDAVYTGDVPSGSGLSSSAAVEVAWVEALAGVADLELDASEAAWLAHQAENDFVGVPSGVMDQFISALGEAGSALLLDCRTLEARQIPFNMAGVSVVVVDTGVHRELAGSEYRKRRADCEAAVKRLQAVLPGIAALRDVSAEQLETHADLLGPVQLNRATRRRRERAHAASGRAPGGRRLPDGRSDEALARVCATSTR
ncbi:MAG: galactokinase [Chloroflexia bacterium]